MPVDQVKALAAANPDNFAAQMALGGALAASNPDAAIAAFEKAAQVIPNVPGEDSPQAAIAAIALKKGDKARAARALETLICLQPHRHQVGARAGDTARHHEGAGSHCRPGAQARRVGRSVRRRGALASSATWR